MSARAFGPTAGRQAYGGPTSSRQPCGAPCPVLPGGVHPTRSRSPPILEASRHGSPPTASRRVRLPPVGPSGGAAFRRPLLVLTQPRRPGKPGARCRIGRLAPLPQTFFAAASDSSCPEPYRAGKRRTPGAAPSPLFALCPSGRRRRISGWHLKLTTSAAVGGFHHNRLRLRRRSPRRRGRKAREARRRIPRHRRTRIIPARETAGLAEGRKFSASAGTSDSATAVAQARYVV